jgi:transposase
LLTTNTVLSVSSEQPINLDSDLSLELERLSGLTRDKLVETLAQSSIRLKSMEEELRGAQLENHYLRELLRLARIEKYGPASEKLSDEQLALLELEPGVSQAEIEAETERAQLKLPLRKARKPTSHPGRQELPAHLPRVEKVIACTPEQCVCAQCGDNTELIGYETSEQLDVEPPKHFVLVTKREKRACRRCEEQGVETAPVPARIIEKSLVSDQLIIDTVVSKYCDHLPLYRQSAILERETGLEISRVTLCGWVMAVGELLMPIRAAMRQELLSGDYIQADETPVDVQSERTKGKNHQAYLWQYSRPLGPVVFDFQLDRSGQGPREFLAEFAGILQTDGYAGYGKVGGTQMVHAGCWAHARRYFFQAVQLNAKDLVALGIVVEVDKLFEIEAEAKTAALGPTERLKLRREKAEPILKALKTRIESARAAALPRSALGKACDYAMGRWGHLKRFLDYGQLELSNNLVENAIRPVAVGRKNWLHIGSERAGPRVAAILSVIETCRRLDIPIRQYLRSVLPGLAEFPANRARELTPTSWTRRRN